MNFEVDNRKYEILIVSSQDGLSCELWDVEKNQLLIEIFWNDTLNKIEFYSAEMNISFELVEKVIATFEKRVGREYLKD